MSTALTVSLILLVFVIMGSIISTPVYFVKIVNRAYFAHKKSWWDNNNCQRRAWADSWRIKRNNDKR